MEEKMKFVVKAKIDEHYITFAPIASVEAALKFIAERIKIEITDEKGIVLYELMMKKIK
jgi:hypothetical protein